MRAHGRCDDGYRSRVCALHHTDPCCASARMKSPQPYFQLILRAVSRIEQYCPPDKETFLAQSMIQDAMLMRLQEIGENLARLRQFDADAFNGMADDSWH